MHTIAYDLMVLSGWPKAEISDTTNRVDFQDVYYPSVTNQDYFIVVKPQNIVHYELPIILENMFC